MLSIPRSTLWDVKKFRSCFISFAARSRRIFPPFIKKRLVPTLMKSAIKAIDIRIAQKNKYIQVKKSEKGSRFEKGVQMQQAMAYLQEWGKQADIDWLVSQFQYTSVDELELLATVDMAICDLRREGKEISVASIKGLIRSNKEWRDKLKKTYFRDSDIQRAIKKCQDLFES